MCVLFLSPRNSVLDELHLSLVYVSNKMLLSDAGFLSLVTNLGFIRSIFYFSSLRRV